MATKRTALANAARTTFHDEELVKKNFLIFKIPFLEAFGISKMPSSLNLPD